MKTCFKIECFLSWQQDGRETYETVERSHLEIEELGLDIRRKVSMV